MNYPRRQQDRRVSRAAATAMASVAAMLLALAVASAGAMSAAGVLLVLALGLSLYARHFLSLAGAAACVPARRTRCGALAPLQAEGWRLRHSLSWRGRGDIDSVALAPTGVAFAIGTKTRAYDDRHLTRAREQAVWLSRRRRRWWPARRGAGGVPGSPARHRAS